MVTARAIEGTERTPLMQTKVRTRDVNTQVAGIIWSISLHCSNRERTKGGGAGAPKCRVEEFGINLLFYLFNFDFWEN